MIAPVGKLEKDRPNIVSAGLRLLATDLQDDVNDP